MSFFTSERERRLWIWTLAVVATIYLTLGFAGSLNEMLRDRGLLELAYILGLILVLAAIVTQWLKARPGGVELAIALGFTVICIMVVVRQGIPKEERTHLIEYSVVAILFYEALRSEPATGDAYGYLPVCSLWR